MKKIRPFLTSVLILIFLFLSSCDIGGIIGSSSSSHEHNYINGSCGMCGATKKLSYTLLEDGYSVSVGLLIDESNIVIPNTYNGIPITSIGENAFSGCSSLKSITIPDSITSIGKAAFEGCSSLESITIPNSVTSIGKYAFDDCNSLKSITIPFVGNTLDDKENTHFGYIFGAPSSSTNHLAVPSSLKEVIITGGTSIGGSAFSGCSSLTSITIPNSITSIDIYAFSGCSSLISITIPESVTSIDGHTFYRCSSLTSITIPESVTSIGEWAFAGCSSLKNIVIPENVKKIDDGAFENCSSLESVIIGNNVTSIDFYAFRGCSSLESITICNNILNIRESAFYGCTSLTNVYYTGSEKQWNAIFISIGNDSLTSATITYNYVPEE